MIAHQSVQSINKQQVACDSWNEDSDVGRSGVRLLVDSLDGKQASSRDSIVAFFSSLATTVKYSSISFDPALIGAAAAIIENAEQICSYPIL